MGWVGWVVWGWWGGSLASRTATRPSKPVCTACLLFPSPLTPPALSRSGGGDLHHHPQHLVRRRLWQAQGAHPRPSLWGDTISAAVDLTSLRSAAIRPRRPRRPGPLLQAIHVIIVRNHATTAHVVACNHHEKPKVTATGLEYTYNQHASDRHLDIKLRIMTTMLQTNSMPLMNTWIAQNR